MPSFRLLPLIFTSFSRQLGAAIATDWTKEDAHINVGCSLAFYQVQLFHWPHSQYISLSWSFQPAKNVKNALFTLNRWERRYQKIGTVKGCMWRVVCFYECPKYNRSADSTSKRQILRPHFIFCRLETAAFRIIFLWIGSGDCEGLAEEIVSSKALFFFTVVWSTIKLLGATPNEPPLLLVSAGRTRRKRPFSPSGVGSGDIKRLG